MKKLLHLAILLYVVAASALAQTTLTTSNVVQNANVWKIGVNSGGPAAFQDNQYLSNLNYVNGGDMPSAYFNTTFYCNAGGTNDLTHWYSNTPYSLGFATNFWQGGSYKAYASTGVLLGTGTFSASTTNTSTGIDLTLSNPLSSICNTTTNDVLIATLFNASPSLTTPQNIYAGYPVGATFNTTDTSPNSTNTIQSLQLPTGSSFRFTIDVASKPSTNPNATVAATNASWLNLNGIYTVSFRYKCTGTGSGSLTYKVGRNGGTSYVSAQTVTPSCTSTAGAGWVDYTHNFTPAEVGAQANGGLFWTITGTTGTMLLQDMRLTENNQLAGNTTIFRDAYICLLKSMPGCPAAEIGLNPSWIRFMDGSDQGSYIRDMIGPKGNMRWATHSNYGPFPALATVSFADKLDLCLYLKVNCWLTVGPYNSPADWAALMNWMGSSGYNTKFIAAGLKVRWEFGNEAWNTGSQGRLYSGNGVVYGTVFGPAFGAARLATGYNSSVSILIANGWVAQGYKSAGQWGYNSLHAAQATSGGLPDTEDNAVYMMNALTAFCTSGANVCINGSPFLDAFAENTNYNITAPTGGYSVLNNTAGALSTFGVGMDLYEGQWGAWLFGQTAPATQPEQNQLSASVGPALATLDNFILLERDSKVTGPIQLFTLQQDEKGAATGGGQLPYWGVIRTMACGPSQLAAGTCVDYGRPLYNMAAIYNNYAIGSNTKLMASAQSGTPTYNYAGGQAVNCPGSNCYKVWPNASTPKVDCITFSDGGSNWSVACVNRDPAGAQTVTIAGPGTPTGSVTEYLFPGNTNSITDNNEATYTGPSSIAPVVGFPSGALTSGTVYSIPLNSAMILTYTVSGSSIAATPTFSPGTGSYSAVQTVTISTATAGATICVTFDGTMPTAPTAGTCGHGATYSGPISVGVSETVNAIATKATLLNSGLGSAMYVITLPVVATPTFSPTPGTYPGTQMVTLADATGGASIYYTTDGSTPTTSSTLYTGAITVSVTTTIQAIAAASGFTNSTVGVGGYSIGALRNCRQYGVIKDYGSLVFCPQ